MRIWISISSIFIFIACSTPPSTKYRVPSSVAGNCRDLAVDILDHRAVEQWDAQRVSKIFENHVDLNHFYRYIDQKYPAELRQKIGDLARKINGFYEQRIYTNFFRELEMAKRIPHAHFPAPRADWSKKTWAYVYVDKFGVTVDGQTATFDDFIRNLDYYKEKLNVSNLYLLPINKSPRMDGGYDVADYQGIDELIGGNEGFKRFVQAARAQDFNIMVDFVPGHTSVKHDWFQKALAGDPKYRDYFININEEPAGSLIKEGGNVYRIYTMADGTQYRRLLLFPDLETNHWHKEHLRNGMDHYFYSSFYPFQKDLNLQNPDVLGEHLNTLGWWVNQGVNGIRADAISWWVKKEGTSGQHLDETLAVSEYFNTFLKYLNKDSVFLPELVDAPETAARYLGHTANINGSVGGSNSNAVFEFEKSVQIFYAGISGDFTNHFKFLNRTRNIQYPENTRHILYSANHHDEIYLGFLGDDAKHNFQRRIKQAGGIVYKEGNSGGAMLADLLDHDKEQMFQFYKFLFGHQGTVAIYQGSALGLGNAWSETYKTTLKQLEEMVERGRMAADNPAIAEVKNIIANPDLINKPPREDGDLIGMIDGRLLHRNRLTQEMLDQAKRGENPFLERFAVLPKLKERSPALNGDGVEEPLDTLRGDIGSFMRRAWDNGQLVQEVAVVKNGTGETTTVRLNKSQLTGKGQFSLRELENNTNFDYRLVDDGQGVEITIPPYQTLWLEVR